MRSLRMPGMHHSGRMCLSANTSTAQLRSGCAQQQCYAQPCVSDCWKLPVAAPVLVVG